MPGGVDTPTAAPEPGTLLGRSRKQRPITELACELVFRPLAHLLVLVLLPLRVPPPAVVLASAVTGLLAAAAVADRRLLAGALLLQAKTILDNADGQFARASGKVTALGRYLDSESDLLVNIAVLIALAIATGQSWLALVSFLTLTLTLSVDFNLDRLYRRERGVVVDPSPPAEGLAGVLARVYAVVYAPQDRLVEWFTEWRLRRIGAADHEQARLAYHDRLTVAIVANFGLSTQLLVLGVCLALGRPEAYLWLVIGCGAALVPLGIRRERRARRALVTAA